MSTLEAQKRRLEEEIVEAYEQLAAIQEQPFPNLKMINYYSDLINRNEHLLEMLLMHLSPTQDTRFGSDDLS